MASDLEEADMRIIPHIDRCNKTFLAVQKFLWNFNDTEMVVLLIFISGASINGFISERGRMPPISFIPVHHIFSKVREKFCRSLLVSHIGTGTRV